MITFGRNPHFLLMQGNFSGINHNFLGEIITFRGEQNLGRHNWHFLGQFFALHDERSHQTGGLQQHSQHPPFPTSCIGSDHMFTLAWCSSDDHLVSLHIDPRSRWKDILFQHLNFFQFNARSFTLLQVDKDYGNESERKKQHSEEGSKGGVLRDWRGGREEGS